METIKKIDNWRTEVNFDDNDIQQLLVEGPGPRANNFLSGIKQFGSLFVADPNTGKRPVFYIKYESLESSINLVKFSMGKLFYMSIYIDKNFQKVGSVDIQKITEGTQDTFYEYIGNKLGPTQTLLDIAEEGIENIKSLPNYFLDNLSKLVIETVGSMSKAALLMSENYAHKTLQ